MEEGVKRKGAACTRWSDGDGRKADRCTEMEGDQDRCIRKAVNGDLLDEEEETVARRRSCL